MKFRRPTTPSAALLLLTANASAIKIAKQKEFLSSTVSTYGPAHCVSVSRNPQSGTCVLATHCPENVSLDSVEFAFTCKKPGLLQKHSFGKGGFDSVEEFDTSVACDVCGLPPELNASLKKLSAVAVKPNVQEKGTRGPEGAAARTSAKGAAAEVRQAAPGAAADPQLVLVKQSKAEPAGTTTTQELPKASALLPAQPAIPAHFAQTANLPDNDERGLDLVSLDRDDERVSFGPGNCISTWLMKDATAGSAAGSAETVATPDGGEAALVPDGEKGVCVMKTNCAAVDPAAFEAYPVGVIATDKTGTPVRHLFGPNSFDKIEEFNTLIRASACFGLDETSEAVTLEGEVKVLSKQLADLKTQVGSLGTAQAATTAQLIAEDKEIKLVEGSRRNEQKEVDSMRREEDSRAEEEQEQDEEEQARYEQQRQAEEEDRERRMDDQQDDDNSLPADWQPSQQ